MPDIQLPVGARFQLLDRDRQALGLAQIVESRNGGTFTRAALVAVYGELALPSPAKVDNVLAALSKLGWIVKLPSRATWRITPVGRHECDQLTREIDLHQVVQSAKVVAGASLGELTHTVVPPSFAPQEISSALSKFLSTYPFELNIFGMTRFPDTTVPDPVTDALTAARVACEAAGMQFHLASDRAISDDLWRNVAAHMWAIKFGVAIFEDRLDRGLNYNLTIEVGGMISTGRRCLLLKDESIPRMPTDLVGKIYKSVDIGDPTTVSDAVKEWIETDLAFAN